jgi:hypothetical protein
MAARLFVQPEAGTARAKTAMAGVKGTTASVTTANELTDAFAATAATAGCAELVVKVLGISP